MRLIYEVFFSPSTFFYPRENSGRVSNIFHACRRFHCLICWKNKLVLEGWLESADTLVVVVFMLD